MAQINPEHFKNNFSKQLDNTLSDLNSNNDSVNSAVIEINSLLLSDFNKQASLKE